MKNKIDFLTFFYIFKKKIMIIKKIYDENAKTQKVLYDSSMILYTEMVEYENENFGDLYVTFKNGSVYKYNKVSFEDYIVFMNGGTDASQGKALNKIIKSKYEYENVGTADVNDIKEKMMKDEEKTIDISNTYFISGHRDLSQEEFDNNYGNILYEMAFNDNIKFVVGDYYGADIMAQNYLVDSCGISPSRITVYHMFDSPRNINDKITNKIGGFKTDEERDAAMTMASVDDIAFVRDIKKCSGTAQNILRRHLLKKC